MQQEQELASDDEGERRETEEPSGAYVVRSTIVGAA